VRAEQPLCSGCGRSPAAIVLTLPAVERSSALASS
jgi:hypothetical protein